MLKELHDGTMVDINTPTKLVGDKRYLLTQAEIDDFLSKGAASDSAKQARKKYKDIAALEATITPRRIREAILGTDNGWLADIEQQIEVLRGL